MCVLDTVTIPSKATFVTTVSGSQDSVEYRQQSGSENIWMTRELERIKKTAHGGVALLRSKFDSAALPHQPPVAKKLLLRPANRLAAFDAIADELIRMFQSVLDQNRNCDCKEMRAPGSSCSPCTASPSVAQPSAILLDPHFASEQVADNSEEKSTPDDQGRQLASSDNKSTEFTRAHLTRAQSVTKDTRKRCCEFQEQWETCEREMYVMLEQRTRELENERLRIRTLENIIQKQDELIAALESRNAVPVVEKYVYLLHEQMELQQAELQLKRDVLVQALEENDEMVRTTSHSHQSHLHQELESHPEDTSIHCENECRRSFSERLSASTPLELSEHMPSQKDKQVAPACTPHNMTRSSLSVGDDISSQEASSADTSQSSPATSWPSGDGEQHDTVSLFRGQPPQVMTVANNAIHPTAKLGQEQQGSSLEKKMTTLERHIGTTSLVKGRKRAVSFWKELKQKLGR